jgi:hypothetical protein
MDPITILGILGSIGGAAMQYKAQQDAAAKQAEETRQSIARQAQFQQQAEQQALGQAREFTTDTRQGKQQQIEQQLTADYIKPVEDAQQIAAAAGTTQGDVSKDFTTAKAVSDLNLMKNARTLAGLMAKTTAAGRLRGNEAISMADTAAGIDRLGNFSRGQAGADQIGIEAAGRPDAGTMLLGGLLQAGGGAAASGVFSGGAGASKAVATAPPIGTGFTGLGSTGLKLPKSFVWG